MLMEMVDPSINGGNLPFWKLMSLPVTSMGLDSEQTLLGVFRPD